MNVSLQIGRPEHEFSVVKNCLDILYAHFVFVGVGIVVYSCDVLFSCHEEDPILLCFVTLKFSLVWKQEYALTFFYLYLKCSFSVCHCCLCVGELAPIIFIC